MRDSFDDVLKDMRDLVKDAPPDGRITVDTLEHFLVRLERMADDSKRVDWIAMYGSYGADSVSGEPGGNGQKCVSASRKNIDAGMAMTMTANQIYPPEKS